MAERHRLGPLQVRVARHRPVRMPGRRTGERGHHQRDGLDAGCRRGPAVEAEVEHDLVVARPAGMERRTRRRDLGQPALDHGVNVLIGVDEIEIARVELALDAPQSTLDRGKLGGLDDPGRGQATGVGDAAGDVIRIEIEVDLERGGEALQLGQQLARESPSPKSATPRNLRFRGDPVSLLLVASYGASLLTSPSRSPSSRACSRPCTWAAVLTPSPQSLMKPAAADWSNASPLP